MRFSLSITAKTGKAHAAFLRRQLRRAHAILRPALIEMSLALVDDATMSDLHERFMNIAGPTDVLTFPLDEDALGQVISGEVIVCVPEAKRRSREHGVELREELLLYALHGMLHLCGFDDRRTLDFKKMHQKEDEILEAIGVGAVFHRGRQAKSGTARRSLTVRKRK
jgi:rRNA maturation RNase YbeY